MQPIASAIFFCDLRDEANVRSKRGWRAYIGARSDGVASLTTACPACAEQYFGEDAATRLR
jgi:hypothetical protein